MAETSKPIEVRVKEEIEKTGLPTEIVATEALRKRGWRVFNEFPYMDTDKEKSVIRTLDLAANKAFMNSKGDDVEFYYDLYIECKRAQEHSWVFFTDEHPTSFISLGMRQLAHNATVGTYNATIEMLNKTNGTDVVSDNKPSVFGRVPLHYETIKSRIAISQQSVFKERTDFFEASMQILKALSHREREIASGEYPPYRLRDCVIPIVVFNGSLFECYFKEGQLTVVKSNHVRYLSHGLPNQRLPTLIDVITADYFPAYLDALENEIVKKEAKQDS